MGISLFDLAGADEEVRFSPHCWRVKMVLAHKGLDAQLDAWHFTEKDRIAFTDQKAVPVLCDGDTTVVDSWKIMQYLESTYPSKPAFQDSPESILFFKYWVERALHFSLLSCVVKDIHDQLSSKDQGYFRETREKMLGRTLEEVQSGREETRKQIQTILAPVSATLADQPFISGDQPSATDYILFAAFMWVRSVSSFQILPEESPVYAWRERMLDLHNGYARKAKGHEVSGAEL